jgi:NAD+ kinase
MEKDIQTFDQRRIAFVAADTAEARDACARLAARYAGCDPDKAEIIVALGGDGFMLETLHRHMAHQVPIYGMNRGTVGFMMNDYREDDLPLRISQSRAVVLHPLRMVAHRVDGSVVGALVATPAGSTAYNLSVGGPIIPLGANLLAVTPISAFRPRRWRGALLQHRARVKIEVLEAEKRPVSAVADSTEVREVRKVEIIEDRSIALTLLFDPEHALEERVLKEQFLP